MGEELTVDVPMEFVGEAPAVEKGGGTLLHLKETLHIKAKPGDLPTSIAVDVSGLADFDATLHVSDISVPKGVTILTDAAEPIARVMAPRTESAETEGTVDLAAGAPAEGEAAEEASIPRRPVSRHTRDTKNAPTARTGRSDLVGRSGRPGDDQMSLVQNLHFLASARTSSAQAGHFLVAGPGTGLGSRTLVMANATNATITKLMTVLMKAP